MTRDHVGATSAGRPELQALRRREHPGLLTAAREVTGLAQHNSSVTVRLDAIADPGIDAGVVNTTSSQDRGAAGTAIRRVLAVVTGVWAAVLMTASPALADDSSFLNEVQMNGTTTEDGQSLWWGHAICTDLQNGVSVRTIYQAVAKQTRANRTVGFMGSAVRNLCPEQMPTLQAGIGSL